MVTPVSSHLFLILVFLSLQTSSYNAYNILGIFPHPAKSHVDVFLALTKGLARKGHNVTVLSHFPLQTPLANYTDINVDKTASTFVEIFDMEKMDFTSRSTMYTNIMLLSKLADISCEPIFKSKLFQHFLEADQKFDVIIVEFFNSDSFLSLAHKFKAPIIGMSSGTIMPWSSKRFANPTHTAYIPNSMMDYSDKMTFFERVENTLVQLHNEIYYEYFRLYRDRNMVKKYVGTEVRLDDLIKNCSLLLLNSHFSLNLPRPFVPSIVEVGGLHIGQTKKIPKNIEKWITESDEGVIYFSLGSMIKGHTFPQDKRNAFLRAFARLPHRVLWKWENETMEGKPDNLMILKWMPQSDILCHPNVKAFISHGGLLGIIEAVHCGVPVLVMPQYGDQHTNAKALEANGGGVILYLSAATEETVYKSLKKILSSSFRQKTKELSERFRDRPLPPLETAIYWVEYVARHRGAPHMRTAAVDMPFYKYYLIDVISFLLLVCSVFIYILYISCKFIYKRLFSKTISEKIKTS